MSDHAAIRFSFLRRGHYAMKTWSVLFSKANFLNSSYFRRVAEDGWCVGFWLHCRRENQGANVSPGPYRSHRGELVEVFETESWRTGCSLRKRLVTPSGRRVSLSRGFMAR